MPQGGIDAGEDPWSAARRELYEETGVTDIEFIAKVSYCCCSSVAELFLPSSGSSRSSRSSITHILQCIRT